MTEDERNYVRENKWVRVCAGLITIILHPIATALLVSELAIDFSEREDGK